ncbi:MAG: primosomal protein N', partial [Acholeplasmatales bacterium]|nr:primosomal protein N' [Acholeplasmatales bacterium]
MYAEVIIDIKNKQVNRSFDYIIPSYLEGIIAIGSRVYVPFGKQKRMGYVLNIKDTTDVVRELKEISDLIDYKPILNEEFMEMAKYISIHDFSFYSTSLDAMIPQALRMKYEKIVKWVTDSLDDSLKNHFKLKKEVSLSRIPKDLEPILFKEIKLGNLVIDTRIKRVRKDKYITYIHNNLLNQRPSSKKGIDLLNYLEEANQDLELSYVVNECGYSKSVIDTLEKNGFISLYKLEAEVEEDVKNYKDKDVSLNDMQKNIYSSLKLNENKVYLLHGVTGSGKTELYMRWIKDAISLGKKALMLVPEISLTPQITAQFYARFKESIAVLHSRLTISEKYDEWKRILNGDVKIVVGARSAIFAPIKDLGIVIVDECHEASYKQSNNPKYNAIDLAKIRAKTYNCPLVLGSATPNAEDYYKALEGEYILLSLPLRANLKPLPKVSIVDLREELKNGNRTPISNELKNALIECY